MNPSPAVRPDGRAAAGICLILLLGFAALSGGAARTKCPTYDEPINTVGAWMIEHRGDWRVHPDHPALWQYWAALPNGAGAIRPDLRAPVWDQMLHSFWLRYVWAADMLFHRPDVDAEGVVARSRAMMLIVAVALGGLVAVWAWQLAGPVAAIAALAFFSLDPNCLGHGSLVKNDLAFAFSALLLMHSLWRLGQRGTPCRACVAALAYAVGFGVKFSALLFLPLTALTLVARAILPAPWTVCGRSLRGRGSRLLAGALLLAGFTGAAYGVIWASYRFRCSPTSDPEARLDTGYLLERMRKDSLEIARSAQAATGPAARGTMPAWEPGLLLRSVLWAERHRVLPQAWLYGITYSYGGLLRREGYLLGERRLTGWWYYLPLAVVFKTPIATLVAGSLAGGAGLLGLRRSRRSRDAGDTAWSALCLLLPYTVFWISLMASRVSVGLRHALTVYPYFFIALGVMAARRRILSSRPRRAAAAVLLIGLLLETLAAYPDYIAFFNVVFRPHRIALLGDSNLDWGQDLKYLATWQQRHPDRTLYLAYFGQADPVYYGIVSRKLPTGRPGEPGTQWPQPGEPAVIAVSVTHLQGIYVRDRRLASFYAGLRHLKPLTILGATIFLYETVPALESG